VADGVGGMPSVLSHREGVAGIGRKFHLRRPAGLRPAQLCWKIVPICVADASDGK
jgi:hypothetical protein